ncbi:MAG: D-alanine--D-alanine ligase [Clostridia bacterium]|nr:D-alanine--D-alanine ligase [Clostridia bacterium]
MANDKKKICVIFGGQSPEHEISLKSATSVIENLDKEKYEVITIGITKDGKWYLYTGPYDKIIGGKWEQESSNKPAVISPDSGDKAILILDGDKITKIHPDVVFPVLHGEFGEDGTIQGLLTLAGIKYVGMGILGSAGGMDKAFSKIAFKDAGIPQADWVLVRTENPLDSYIEEIEQKLGYPCFVKPCRTGSSVGVGKAHNREELISSLTEAAKFDRKILVEEFVDGHEVECAVLGNENPRATVVGEILPTVEFYDFDAKYNDNSTKLQIPADLPNEVSDKIREYAVKAFRALDGQGLSRVDFFVKYKDNQVVLNEINTMPGFTNISMYPKLWNATGISYKDLLDELINLGEKRVK